MSEGISQESMVADRLRLWLEGVRPGPGIHDVLIAGLVDEAHMKLLPTSEESLVFVEESQLEIAQSFTNSKVVPYNGEFSTNGGEVGIGDGFVVQLEGYATAPYVAISCPTVFSIEEDEDREAVAADAETAFASGVFPRFLLTPLVTVLDQHYWQSGGRLESDPARLFVSAANSALLSGPSGDDVVVSGETCSTAAPVVGETNAELLSGNRGIGRFLGAAKVLRAAQSRFGGKAEVAGFGNSLLSGETSLESERSRSDSVFVIVADKQYFVTDVRSGKLSKVPKDVAVVVETVLAGVEPDQGLLDRLGLKIGGKQHSLIAQLTQNKDLQALFARLSLEIVPTETAVAPPAVAVPVNPALTIVPVIIT